MVSHSLIPFLSFALFFVLFCFVFFLSHHNSHLHYSLHLLSSILISSYHQNNNLYTHNLASCHQDKYQRNQNDFLSFINKEEEERRWRIYLLSFNIFFMSVLSASFLSIFPSLVVELLFLFIFFFINIVVYFKNNIYILFNMI